MAPIKKYEATKKYGARIQFTDETLFPGDDWYYLAAGHEWYNPVSQSTISEEDMPWELKPGPTLYELLWTAMKGGLGYEQADARQAAAPYDLRSV